MSEPETRVYRTNGKLVIEVPEEIIISACGLIPGSPVKVTDSEKLFNHLAEQILDFNDHPSHEGPSMFARLMDALVIDAVEMDAGVEEIEVIY
ncbi:MAG: hypothetical protein AAGA46_00285 [Cyanobacteria bacterium P01_F01_bin.13]